MTPLQRKKALASLLKSDIWQYIRRTMEGEMVMAARQIAANRSMTLDEINFRRGAIWAAEQFLELPSRLQLIAENELAITKDDHSQKGD